MKQRIKRTLRGTIRDILIAAALVGAIFGGSALWDETRQAAASDYEMPARPTSEEDEPEPRVDFAALRRGAPEALAWISVPGTRIDYPVVQWTDNQYYLKRTARHEHSSYGAIFMDYRNNGNFTDFYTIIYGHNMRSGKMFGTLRQFRDPDFFDRVEYGTLQTPGQTYRLHFFAWAAVSSVGPCYKSLTFVTPGEKQAFFDMAKEKAGRWRNIALGPEDRILALSTCFSSSGNTRMIVFAKLESVEPGADG